MGIFVVPLGWSARRKGIAIIAWLDKEISIVLIGLSVIPLLLLPHPVSLQQTSRKAVGTMVYTWTDENREDVFTPEADYRNITVQFWYPAVTPGESVPVLEGPFPLVAFSHRAFGYRMSNHSTFMESAGNGYIVASIDHTHQAFRTKESWWKGSPR